MYIQITNNCNMFCGHCGYSCGPRKKDFMTMDIFKSAINLTNSLYDYVNIGGGEPTCHPLFWDMLIHALIEYDGEDIPLWLATNGKKTEDALKLARLAKRGIISCELSLDQWHEPIEKSVEVAFRSIGENEFKRMGVFPGIRTVSKISNIGRGKKTGLGDDICICESVFVDPHGNVYSCGCKKHKFGHISEVDADEIQNFYEERGFSLGECIFEKY